MGWYRTQAIFPNITPQTILTSYNGKVFNNMVVDPEIIQDSDMLPSFFLEELKQLTKECGLSEDDIFFN